METKEKVEIIKQAIKQLMEDEDINNIPTLSAAADDDNSGRRLNLLKKLLSQLESIEGYEDEPKQETDTSGIISMKDDKAEMKEKDNTVQEEVGSSSRSVNEEIIIKELKNVQRQNLITHCLISAMIVLTLAWQLSEVSLILKIKDGLSNPLKSIGGIFGGFFKGRHQINVQDAMKHVSEKQKEMVIEPLSLPTSIPGIKIPELPQLDLPGFDSSDDQDE